MKDEIQVKVKSAGPSRYLCMYYVDPVSGKRKVRTTGTDDEREAERLAAVWEDELNTGRYASPNRIMWADFREQLESEKLAGMPPTTQAAYASALNHVEAILNPDRLSKLTSAVLSKFQAELRKPKEVFKNGEKVILPGMKPTTIAKTLRHIKAALRWAEKMGMISKTAKIEMPKLPRGKAAMKGRPITGEEFDRMLSVVRDVLTIRTSFQNQHPRLPSPQLVKQWKQFITGLWLSGLRLGEALALSWDDDAQFHIDLTGRRPVFVIQAAVQKSRRDEVLPLTPDFAEWLQSTYPERERVGKVFRLSGPRGSQLSNTTKVGNIVGACEKKAGIVVNKEDGKFASAHDLRRAFGTRWAIRVKPATLQLLMRHSDIGTTMRFYVAQDATDVADELWASYRTATPKESLKNGNTYGNNRLV